MTTTEKSRQVRVKLIDEGDKLYSFECDQEAAVGDMVEAIGRRREVLELGTGGYTGPLKPCKLVAQAWGDYKPVNLEHARMIRDALDEHGWTEGLTWRRGEDGDDEVLVGRFRLVDDVDDEAGPFAGEEGEVIVSVVGAAEYRNQRVYVGFVAEGTDSPGEVRDPSLELESVD